MKRMYVIQGSDSRKYLAVIIIILVALISSARNSSACTAFSINRGDSLVVVGKNYDWDVDDGLIIVNQRKVAKAAFGQASPASWVSRYGSITFNQYGREMPDGGINEAGLVVEVLWLHESAYPSGDKRDAIGNLQWIQYQLDNCSTIDQVIASDTLIRIAPDFGINVQYFVCDSSGRSAVIEFLDGKMKSFAYDNLPVAAITNDTYEQSIDYIKKYDFFGGEMPLGDRHRSARAYSREASLDRFAHAAQNVKEYDPVRSPDLIKYAFGALEETRSGDRTQWSIVYDIPARKVYCRTSRATKLKTIDMKVFDFSCHAIVKIMDINSSKSGEVSNLFEDYSFEANLDLIQSSVSKTGILRNIPAEVLIRLAGYPGKFTCSE